jgi:hypothetical protein
MGEQIDHATQIFYHNYLLRQFPGLERLTANGAINPGKITEIFDTIATTYSTMLWDEAIDHITGYLNRIQNESAGRRPKVGFAPAGGIFRKVLNRVDLSGVEVCGAFDSSIKQHEFKDGTHFFPLTSIGDMALDALIVPSGTYNREICNQIEGDIDISAVKIFCPYWEMSVVDDKMANSVSAINRICEVSNDRHTLAFVCMRFYSFLYKRLVALKDAGFDILLICLEDHISHAMDLDEVSDCVDYIYTAENNLLNFLWVLKSISPDLAHFFLNAGDSQVPALTAEAFRYPYVVEYNDMLTNMHDRESFAKTVGEQESEYEFQSEKYLISHSQGLIYNNHKSAVEHLFEYYDIRVPVVEFLYYSLRRLTVANKREPGEIRLIFIGGITRNEYNHLCNYSFADTLAMIDSLTAQGFQVDIYNAYDPGDSDIYFELYEKQRMKPKFTYHKAVHPRELSGVISNYDAGLIISDYRHSKMKRTVLERTMSSRLFEYFEAGLPVVISQELKYMSDIIKTNSLGVVIDYERIDSLHKMLTWEKIRAYRSNVKKYVDTIQMKDHIGRLADFYTSSIK